MLVLSRGWPTEIPQHCCAHRQDQQAGAFPLPLPGAAGAQGDGARAGEKPVPGVGGCRWLPE